MSWLSVIFKRKSIKGPGEIETNSTEIAHAELAKVDANDRLLRAKAQHRRVETIRRQSDALIASLTRLLEGD